MKYDFDELVERRGTNCVKWDESPSDDVIPLWVADMDFRVSPAIQKALLQRVEHGVFGYNIVPLHHGCRACDVLCHQGPYHARREGAYSFPCL